MRRLKFIFNLNRVWNFFWMILCAVIIELTLMQNHMLGALATYGQITYPSQLLPLVIGAASFIRVLFLIYAEAREKQDEKKKGKKGRRDANPTPEQLLKRRQSFGIHVRKAFSPNLGKRSSVFFSRSASLFEKEKIANASRPRLVRYMLSWLPWVGLFGFCNNSEPPDLEVPAPPKEEVQSDLDSPSFSRAETPDSCQEVKKKVMFKEDMFD